MTHYLLELKAFIYIKIYVKSSIPDYSCFYGVAPQREYNFSRSCSLGNNSIIVCITSIKLIRQPLILQLVLWHRLLYLTTDSDKIIEYRYTNILIYRCYRVTNDVQFIQYILSVPKFTSYLYCISLGKPQKITVFFLVARPLSGGRVKGLATKKKDHVLKL